MQGIRRAPPSCAMWATWKGSATRPQVAVLKSRCSRLAMRDRRHSAKVSEVKHAHGSRQLSGIAVYCCAVPRQHKQVRRALACMNMA